jgi:hypothetical protein
VTLTKANTDSIWSIKKLTLTIDVEGNVIATERNKDAASG